MNLLKKFFTLLSFALIFAACEKEPEQIIVDNEIYIEAETPSLIESDKNEFQANATAHSATIYITSEKGWKMMANHEEWLTISPKSSDKGGRTKVTLMLTENTTYSERATTLLFYTIDSEVEVRFAQLGRPIPDECCGLSKESIEFASDNFEPTNIVVTTYNEPVSITADNLDLFCTDYPAEIKADSEYTLTLCPSSSNIHENRDVEVTFTGKESGKTRTLAISQDNLYTPTCGFPAKWEISGSLYTDTSEAGLRWVNQGYSYANVGNGSGNAIITAASSDTKRHPKYSILNKTMAVSNLTTDDYLLFCVPVTSVKAGCDFDFMLTLDAASPKAPKYWIFEYFDGGEWHSVEEDLKTATEDGATRYSFYIKNFSSSNHTTFVQSFTLQNAIEEDFVRMRCRVVGKINGEGGQLYANESAQVYLPRMTFMTCYLHCYDMAPAIKDTHKLLALGNSFTYYYGSVWMLKEIARREGHQLRVRANLKGSQSFGLQLGLELTDAVVNEGGYDYALLQDTSNGAADFYRDGCPESADRLKNTRTLTSNVRRSSPDATIILEHTWAHPYKDNLYRGYGDYNNFAEYLLNGAFALYNMSPEVDWLSPVGVAFRKANDEGYSLLHTDFFHQNRNGSYLKSCVNYLMIFGEPFGDNPTDCGVEAATAKRFREIAEEVVLGNESKYKKQ